VVLEFAALEFWAGVLLRIENYFLT